MATDPTSDGWRVDGPPALAERDGLADHLIHDLFAVGLTLASCASIAVDDATGRRLRSAIDDLDRIIRDIRVAATGSDPRGPQLLRCPDPDTQGEVVELFADRPISRPEMVDVDFAVPSILGAGTAELVAEFMAWVPLPMDRNPDGSFAVTLRLETGRNWRYRFLLDGERWVNDWSALDYVVDDDGSGMSLLGT